MRLRATILALSCAALASACTGASYDALQSASISPAPQIYAARFSDRDPVDFGRRHPGRHAVHGIDVSKYQTSVDWATARAHGVSFAFIKATEGGDRVDDRFAEHWRGARAAGVPRGAYHFFYFCRPASEQADWFIRNVPRESGALPPVLDMEWNHKSPTCKLRPPAETVRREMKIWLGMVQRHYGKRPIIYTTVDFHRENLAGHFPDEMFWLRATAEHPSDIYPGREWHFWQYTATGQVPGIKGDADINAFAGTKQEWAAWLRKAAR